ncbi:MAG TPA: hydroxymethylbilane synthase [Syntrophales bacterium]|nr:hydroxymethylbilane synthase [Syntrophales bacterium]HPQ43068.1 hydroxymethylbilane synthase [Syntrophales bacterium]
MSTIKKIRIGTRGSDLALVQANWVSDRLRGLHKDLSVEIVPIRTRGDRMQNISLVEIGGKGVFVKEIEEALLRGDIDIAVHSMKDVPVDLPEGLIIGTIPEREDSRDVLISREGRKMEGLPKGARIGTGSLRRRMQIKSLMPDIEIVPIRGNIDTRIKKIVTENLDGIIIAAAGMKRMGRSREITQYIPLEVMMPSVGQGVLGLESREDDRVVEELIRPLNHPDSMVELSAERTFLRCLGGGCQVPIAGIARKQGDSLIMKGLVGSVDGRVMIMDEVRGNSDDWEDVGSTLAENILSRGGQAILDDVYA